MNPLFYKKLFLFALISTLFSCKASSATSSTPTILNENTLEKDVQEDDTDGVRLEYKDKTYRENIQTVQLYKGEDQLSFPILFLGSNDKLQLHFDDLSGDFKNYNYAFEHCNANWEPSGLVMNEFIDGFFDAFIQNYEYSFNTLFSYVHYDFSFPNQDIRFKKSGNYILKVFEDNDQDKLVLTKRFYVIEKRVNIESNIHMATLARHRDYKQEIDFTINHKNYPIQDPFADLKVVIMQNRRQDNAIVDLKPLFVRTPELIYNYEDKNLFDGNNEYRFFDTKDLRYQSLNIDGIQIQGGKTHVYILPQEPRSFKRYYFQQDLNGRRLIQNDFRDDATVSADYILTHFTLKRETKVPNADVYVFGELSDWDFKPEFKMEYLDSEGEYRLTTQLKQGYYNYNYVVLPNGSKKGDISIIEGTHSETNNEYYIFVYHRQNGEIFDRLIGFELRNTNGG